MHQQHYHKEHKGSKAEVLEPSGRGRDDFLLAFRKENPLKVRKGHLAQGFEIRGVVKEGNDPLSVSVNE